MKKSIPLILLFANGLLLSLGWILALYAYPRLPEEIPFWINFFNQQILLMKKSIFFFLYPVGQTFFCLFFWLLSRKDVSGGWLGIGGEYSVSEKKSLFMNLRKEFIYLVLIFFNLIFIHLQRSLIFLAHNVEEGLDKFYFFLLFVIILALIPYYRLRKKLLLRKKLGQLDKNKFFPSP